MPIWTLLMVVGLLPGLALLVGRHYGRFQQDTGPSANLSESSDSAATQALETELVNMRSELASYKSLEREVLGLLASGEELNLNDILSRLAVKYQPNGAQQLRLAIASLQEKGRIVGTGGLMSRLKSVTPSIRELS
jgi:hypothetical protein